MLENYALPVIIKVADLKSAPSANMQELDPITQRAYAGSVI
jgi:hypothetical protein